METTGAEQKGATNEDRLGLFSRKKGLWSVAEEALLPRSRVGVEGLSGLRAGFVCGGSV